MPWNIVEHDGQFCLQKKGTTEIVKGSCHANKADTMAMMRALYANEPKMKSEELMENNSLTYYGGAVKALGGGKISGYLAIFTSAESPDLQGEFFTKSTDFDIESGDRRSILYRHGVHPTIKSRKLGRGTLTVDDVGVFIEGELNLRDKYEKAIYKLAELGKLGWSSGTMGHVMDKRPKGKSMEIVAWPIGEASLTPAPVEGRTQAIAVKDLGDDLIDIDEMVQSFEDQDQHFALDGVPSIKAYCESVAPASLTDGIARSKLAAHAAKEFNVIGRIIGEAFRFDMSRLTTRTEHRFLKEGRDIDPSTIANAGQVIKDIDEIVAAFHAVKESLQGILRLSEMTTNEKKALDEQGRLAVWNYYRISGTTPQELNNGD